MIRSIVMVLAAAAVLAAPHVGALEPAPDAAPEKGPAAPDAKQPAPEQPAATEPASKKEPASKEELKALVEELRRLKLELGLRDVEYQSYAGMGPAASKVYFAPKGLSLGGYGEIAYRTFTSTPRDAQSDLLRAVLYAGYRFTDRIVFNSEFEFEHAGHEVSVEFAYLDFVLSHAVRFRVGNVLVPIGFVNEMHEPPFFNGVLRPDLETRLIPSTWNENGLGVYGEVGRVRYKAYLLTGLDLFRDTGAEPIEPASWIRESRSGGGESRAATLAGVGRVDVEAGPATVGAALYRGLADQRDRTPSGDRIRAAVTLAEAHAQVAFRGLTARVLAVVGTLGDAAAVNARLGLPTDDGLGSRVQGGYVEVGYDVLSLVPRAAASSVTPFLRLERLDLNARVPGGYTRNPALDRSIVTAGVTYKPIATVVVKADWQRRDSAATSAVNQIDAGVGFVF